MSARVEADVEQLRIGCLNQGNERATRCSYVNILIGYIACIGESDEVGLKR